jgi:hypothetical protein
MEEGKENLQGVQEDLKLNGVKLLVVEKQEDEEILIPN